MSPLNTPCGELPEGFTIKRDAGNPQEVINTAVGGSRIDMVVDGPDGANHLLIFSGVAILELQAPDDHDSDIVRGNCQVALDYPMPRTIRFITSATTAALAAIRNQGTDDWLFAVDCVSTQPLRTDRSPSELVLTAALAIASGDGDTNLIRMSYQANVFVRIEEAQLDSFLVSDLATTIPPGPPDYEPRATIYGGRNWGGQINLTGPLVSFGLNIASLASSNSSLVTVPPWIVLTDQTEVFVAAPTSPVDQATDVTVSATYKSITKTATLTLLPPPR